MEKTTDVGVEKQQGAEGILAVRNLTKKFGNKLVLDIFLFR